MTLIEKAKEKIAAGAPEPHFAVFDFDNTCVKNDIQEAMLAYLCRHSLLRNSALADVSLSENKEEYHKAVFQNYHGLLEKKDVLGAYRYAIRTLAGFSVAEINELTLKTIEEEGETTGETELFGVKIAKGLRVRSAVREIMEALDREGIDVWTVTASSEPVVAAALKYFNLPGKCVGMRLKEENGALVDAFIEPLSVLEGKVECIKQFIHPSVKPLFGIGDSMNDLPMLEYAEIKAVVDRGNALSEKAKKEGWEIVKDEV